MAGRRGAPKGNKFSKGRPKGKPNAATVEFKEAVKHLIEYATPQMTEWLSVVAQEDPSRALEHIFKFAQFGYPLLARSEHTGPDGKDIKHTVTINVVGN